MKVYIVWADEGYPVGVFSEEQKEIAIKYAGKLYRHGSGHVEEWPVDQLVPYVEQQTHSIYFNPDGSIKRVISRHVSRDDADNPFLLPAWADINNGPYRIVASNADEAKEIAIDMRSRVLVQKAKQRTPRDEE